MMRDGAPFLRLFKQQFGEQEGRQVNDAEDHLVAVRCQVAAFIEYARIVDQHMDLGVCALKFRLRRG